MYGVTRPNTLSQCRVRQTRKNVTCDGVERAVTVVAEKESAPSTTSSISRFHRNGHDATSEQKHSMDNGAQYSVIQNYTHLLCSRANQSKMTRECDLGSPSAACLLEREQISRGFHMLCAKKFSELGAAETDEEGLSITCSEEQSAHAQKEG